MSARDDAILALWRSGKTTGQVADALNISRNAVSGVVSRARARGENVGGGRDFAPARAAKRKAAPLTPSLSPERRGSKAKARTKSPRPAGERVAAKPSGEGVFERAQALAFQNTSGSLDDVQATGACRYPLGDPKAPGFRFCGKQRAETNLAFAADPMPYCVQHRALCVSKAQPRGGEFHGASFLGARP